MTDAAGSFQADVFKNTGIWSTPRYSPLFTPPGSDFVVGRMAYLQARNITNSINPQAEYDLAVTVEHGVAVPGLKKGFFPGSATGTEAEIFTATIEMDARL